MRALQARDAFTFQQPVELSAGATIGITDQNLVELCSCVLNGRSDCISNLVRRVVQAGWQAPQCHVGQTIDAEDLQDFARQRPASQDQLAALWFTDLGARGNHAILPNSAYRASRSRAL